MIHAIICSVVPMSGAGTSVCGPMKGSSSDVNRRVNTSSSRWLIARGSQATPPFAPPYGRSINAHFQLIHIASAATSPSSTPGAYRSPPFPGPSVR